MKLFIFSASLLFIFAFAMPVDVATAQGQSGAPGNFVTCDGPDCDTCDLVSMTNTIIKWLFGIFFLIFAVMMVISGFKLVTSGGNQSALDGAKSMFQSGIIGLIIVLAAWILVDTVMRGLLQGGNGEIPINGWGPWATVQCTTQTTPTQWLGDPAEPRTPGQPAPAPLAGPAPTGCTGGTCAALGIPCKTANSCSISPDLVDNFQAMHAAAGVPGAWVSEGMPPTRVHKSACHTNGTCIDYSKPGGMSSAEVVKVINAASANGLRPVYEVKTASEKNALVAAGAPSGSIVVLGNWISAPHFSIYGY